MLLDSFVITSVWSAKSGVIRLMEEFFTLDGWDVFEKGCNSINFLLIISSQHLSRLLTGKYENEVPRNDCANCFKTSCCGLTFSSEKVEIKKPRNRRLCNAF